MPLYEVVLRFPDREEVRLTDDPPPLDSLVDIAGRRWRVQQAARAHSRLATGRLICVAGDDDPGEGVGGGGGPTRVVQCGGTPS